MDTIISNMNVAMCYHIVRKQLVSRVAIFAYALWMSVISYYNVHDHTGSLISELSFQPYTSHICKILYL